MKVGLVKAAKDIVGAYATDSQFTQINYNYLRLKFGKGPRLLNLSNPKRFSEKIAWLKLFYRHPDAHILADKYAVRDYVQRRVGAGFLIPLFGVYESPSLIDPSELPNRFVVKPNHASGEVLFCDKKSLDLAHLRSKATEWLALDYGKLGREYQYSLIPRRIVIEQDLSELAGTSDIVDYKFFCFNGAPLFVQVDLDRFTNHTRNFYDLSWGRQPFRILHQSREAEAIPPKNLNLMAEVAKELSVGLAFARVDLYEIQGKVYFGEITLHPGGGIEPIWPEAYDLQLGQLLNLSELLR